ncbi:MAG: hypothetical protein FWG68_01460 [Defluviitaleaceae bacterium]|nr:hypothetical protein [Defluviitaleaceae bacterium]
MKYLEQCKYIWKNLVPKQGQANNLQGELLRQIEKLRHETQNNGNINWDSDFEYFCDFLTLNLCESGLFSAAKREEIYNALLTIKGFGQFMHQFHNGQISLDEFEETLKVRREFENVVKDELYDKICDAIGRFYAENQLLIPYNKNPNIFR